MLKGIMITSLKRVVRRFPKRSLLVGFVVVTLLGFLSIKVYASYGGAPKVSSTSDIELQRGLVGYWPFNGNAKDSTPNGDNAAVTGATLTADRKNTANSAYAFVSASSQYLTANYTTALAPITAMSMSLWFKPTSVASATAQTLVSSKENGGYVLVITGSTAINNCPATTLCFGLFINSSSSMTVVSVAKSILTSSTWYHLAATYDGTTMKLYLNGSLIGSTATTGAITTATTTNICFGSEATATDCTGGVLWNGSIDDIRIYNRPLNSGEVGALYAQYDAGLRIGAGENGLVGWWKFDGNAKDSSPFADNGTVTTANLAPDRKGIANSAYAFGGASYITIPNASWLNQTAAISVSAWVKTTVSGSGSIQGIVCKDISGSITNCPYSLQLDGTNAPCFFISNSSNTNYSKCNTGIPLSTNVWHYLVGTYDGSTMLLYVDGVNVGGTLEASPIGMTTGPLNIGQQKAGNSRFFTGSIDDVRIYKRALSASEIATQYASYNSGVQVSNLQNGLVGDWPMNGNAKDDTPYSDNGIVTGATLSADRKGRANSAYSFNGTSNYIQLPVGTEINQPLSIAAWVDPTSYTSASTYIFGADPGVRIAMSNTGYLFATVVINGASAVSIGYNVILPLNTWSHVVFTLTGSTAYLYLNGASVSSNTTLTNGTVTYSASQPYVIGADNYSSNPYHAFFTGSIDDASMWSRALTSAEVSSLYRIYR